MQKTDTITDACDRVAAPFQRRFLAVAVALALGMACALGIWWYRDHKRYRHFAEHDPGMVFRSGWLESETLAELIAEHQIRAVVNLCRTTEMAPADWEAERRVVRRSGARLLTLPMPVGVASDDETIRQFVAMLGDCENYPLLVHCQHGVTRTAQLLVIYDVAFRGMTARDSLEAMSLFGRKGHNVQVRAFGREFEQRCRKLYPAARPDRLSALR